LVNVLYCWSLFNCGPNHTRLATMLPSMLMVRIPRTPQSLLCPCPSQDADEPLSEAKKPPKN
jgi:hypothetical protein